MNPVEFAKNGDLEYFKNIIEFDTLQNFEDSDGNSLLAIAAKELHLECCQEILKRCPPLLYHQSIRGCTVLHIVLLSCPKQDAVNMLQFFINAEEDIKRSEVIPQTNNLLTMADCNGYTALHTAVAKDVDEAVRLLIQADSDKTLVMMVNDGKNTALHMAVKKYVSEDLAKFLVDSYHGCDIGFNKGGETPFLIVLRKYVGAQSSAGYTMAGNFLALMLSKEPHLAKARRGDRGRTALHSAAFSNNINAFSLLLEHCPDCSEVVDHIGQNFLHIAAENGCVDVVRHALRLESEKLPYALFNQQDKNGCTPLHIAALKENQSLTECLLYDNRVSKTTINIHNQKVLDAINFRYDRVRAGVFSSKGMSQKEKEQHLIDFAKRGDLEYFKDIVDINTLQNFRDEDGYSLLSIAAKESHLEFCQEILRMCPSLLHHQTNDGNTVLHVIPHSHKFIEMLKIFIDAEEDMKRSDTEDLLMMENHLGKTILHQAVKFGDRHAVSFLIQADTRKKLLEMVDKDKNTALHLAMPSGGLKYSPIAELLIDSYPSFHKIGSNKDGDTPFLMALRVSRFVTTAGFMSGRILEMMLDKEPDQAKAQIGSRGWTALHHAAFANNTIGVSLLLKYCPDCCMVVDYAGRNCLHIAAEKGLTDVVNCVLGIKNIPIDVFSIQDKDGNSPLHTAALKDNENLTKCLLYDNRISKATTNIHDQKVLDAISFEYDKVKAGVFGRKEMSQKTMKEQGEFDLVVSALIAAVTFTAGITIPGGYFSDGPSQGMAVLSNRASFFAFVISNNFALMFSLYAVFSHFCARRLLTIEDTIYQLNVATRCTFGAIFAMMVAFITGSYIVLASSKVLSITACVQCCCFFIFAANAMRKMIPSHAKFWKKINETPTTSKGLENV